MAAQPAVSLSRVLCRPSALAMAAFFVVLSWQALTVHANYAGNWTGLFRTGARASVPALLQSRTIRSAHPDGYDGQFYRFLAHDPLLRHGTAASFDAPALRARRILVPALAFILAAGQHAWIDAAYILIIDASVAAGVFCLALLFLRCGRSAPFGLLFLLLPPSLIAVDSMTVDATLAALTAAFALCLATSRRRVLWMILAAAPLVRETGLLLIAAAVLASLWQKHFRAAAILAAAAVPFLLWLLWLNAQALPLPVDPRSTGMPRWLLPHLHIGILERLFHVRPYLDLTPALRLTARALDLIAVLATIATGLLILPRIRFAAGEALNMALVLFASLLLVLTDKYFWNTPYGYARAIGPLFVLLLATPSPRQAWAGLSAIVACCLLIDFRIAAEMFFQLRGIIAWLSPL